MSRMYTQEQLDQAFEQVCAARRSIPRENFTKEVVAEIRTLLDQPSPPSSQDSSTDPEIRF